MSESVGWRNLEHATALVAGLVAGGVRHSVVCPGSRSTPLALALLRHSEVRVWMHIDERSAGFFGLGIARANGDPVVLLCSSGTAAANFLPAIAEAFLSRVPLVAITADRPPELRGWGASQTIDQIGIFGSHVKWFTEMPAPDEAAAFADHACAAGARAVAIALAAPAGPVHLNAPYREPLLPADGGADIVAVGSAPVVLRRAERPDPGAVAVAAAHLGGFERGLVVCGPQDDPALPAAAAQLAAALGWPLLADPLSGARCGPHDRSLAIDAYDAFLRDMDLAAALRPAAVVRIGAIPTSKPLTTFLAHHPPAESLLLDNLPDWRDPAFLTTTVLDGNPAQSCADLAVALTNDRTAPLASPWIDQWREVNRQTRSAIEAELARDDEPFEGRVFAELAEVLPDGAVVMAGNSMPVRDLDAFFPSGPRRIRFVANRGANGIDGVVSTALGLAAADCGPVVLTIGDLSFLHDANGLLAAKLHRLDATIVVLNNDGGGIFSFLPQAAALSPAEFETLFGTPVGVDVAGIARLYGADFQRPPNGPAFQDAVQNGISSGGLSVVEVRSDRARNVARHRAIWAAVRDRIGAAARG
ncbi:MAG: 2-succinyl-5-enolpyruvyl-6-hydroxy-3-cyclohexene-1-carboxylic-acid synthase [Thermomicrobiales bacterium]|nr:2-succinyl-5-enolpyruvyl-6-hydroxy-3-cyclohexene-1-carboxylic-acid synthase [Thermomicrobiales bacterium]